MTELLTKIKNEVAQSHEYADWYQIDMTDSSELEKDSVKASMLDEIATRYATEVAKRSLEKAAEMAKVINWWDSENGIREYMSKVSKQSITDESNISL